MRRVGEVITMGATSVLLLGGCGEASQSDRNPLDTPAVVAPTVVPTSEVPDVFATPDVRLSPTGVSFIFDDLLVKPGVGETTILTYMGPGDNPHDRTPYMIEGLWFEKGDQLPVECVEPNGREVRSHKQPNDGERAVQPSTVWYRLTAPKGMHPFASDIYGDATPPTLALQLPHCPGATGLAVPMPGPQAQ